MNEDTKLKFDTSNLVNKHRRKPMGKSRTDNPEKLDTGTQGEDNKKQQKTIKMSNTDPTKKTRSEPGTHEGQIVHAFYNTPAVLLLLTIKSSKSLGSDRGNKQICIKGKRAML
jgi:hypothetical protein